jgi:hypothetical protein
MSSAVGENGGNQERGAARLTVGVPFVVAASLFLIGQLVPGQGLCAAPGYGSATAQWYGIAVFALPAVAVAGLLVLGFRRGWRLKTLVWTAVTSIILSGMFCVFVTLWVAGEEGCFK